MAASRNDSGGAAVPDASLSDGGLPGFGEAHRHLLQDPSIQFDLRRPDGSSLSMPQPGAHGAAQPPQVQPAPPPGSGHGAPDPFFGGGDAAGSAAVTEIVFWVVIGFAAAALLFFIVTRLAGWRRAPREEKQAAPRIVPQSWQMAAQPARTLLDQADALAADGRYAEAAHFLLHRSIEEIDRRRPAAVRKALTSRDIARLPGLPPGPAAGFAGVVRAVERSLFADRPLDVEAWGRCREDYRHFAFAENWAQ